MRYDQVNTSLADEASLAAAAVHDSQAFTVLYNFYFPRVFTYIRVRVADDQAADDLTSQVFERVLTKINRYQPDRAPFGAWLFGIARNTVNNHIRSRRRHSWLSLEFLGSKAASDSHPEDQVQQYEDTHQLWKAINRLREAEREMVLLKYVGGLSSKEIARLSGQSVANTDVILFRARQQLKAHLNDMEKSRFIEPDRVSLGTKECEA